MSARQVWPYVVLVATFAWSTAMVLMDHAAVAAAVVPAVVPALLQLAGTRRELAGTRRAARGDARRAVGRAGEAGGPEPGAEPERNKEQPC
ncbi:hypothetical protein [Streptomyces abyssomicinicus]|uniref:hypothetical protein n=1 Tax=Streptomyces abyssomicinicus TaxID=574929 RepID=UPI001250792B|nr:hypothetical protein [Streptomyces abyssomicinicus]